MIWHSLKIPQIFELLNTSEKGLSEKTASERIHKYGTNTIIEQKKKTIFRLLASQFTDIMILVLIAAAIIAGIIGEYIDTIVILIIVVLNAVIGFIQEYRAEKAIDALKKISPANSKVIRENKIKIISSDFLVPGDIVLLETGNIIPADIRIIESHNFRIDESSLTGESNPIEKITEHISECDIPIGDRENMIYKGTFSVYGRAKGVVVATGMDTELGKIAKLLQEDEVKTPLQIKLGDFSKKLAVVVFFICIIIFLIGLVRGEAPVLMMMTAISLAVAAIPEALPAVSTITLALGAKRLVKQNALIRKLPATETLGSVTYICTDKTGTLTQNKMQVQVVFDGKIYLDKKDSSQNNEYQNLLLSAMVLNNDVAVNNDNQFIGDPTETALLNFSENKNFKKNVVEQEFPRIAEIPFDSSRKCMTTIHKYNNEYIILTKGAIEVLTDSVRYDLKSENKLWIDEANKMSSNGLRVIGFAYKKLEKLPENISSHTIENNFEIIGLAGLNDPPREEVYEAIKSCAAAGIKTVMITGDHKLTAKAIASELKIISSESDLIMTGAELCNITETKFEEKVEDIKIYARVSPEQKLNIVKALQKKGEFVAMTGDGVNDAPSLKRADIGIAMGINGTDVAKESAHMILLDDNFATIVKAIKEGRRIYDNIRKFIKYILTTNSSEIWVIFLAPFFALPIPLLPLHILWINLISDGLPCLALATDPPEKNIMNRPPRNPKENIFSGGLGIHVLWVGFMMGAITILTQAVAINLNIANWQTIVFSVLCLSQLGNAFTARSETDSVFKIGFFSNRPLIIAVFASVLLQLFVIYTPFMNSIFKTAPLSINELGFVFLISSLIFFIVEFQKLIKKKFQIKTA